MELATRQFGPRRVLGGVGQTIVRDLGGPVVDPHRGRLRLGVLRAAPVARPGGHLRGGVLEINRLIAMNIGHEPAAQGVAPVQKSQSLAVATVHPDRPEVQPPSPRLGDHLQRQCRLATVVPSVLRDGGLLAARRVVRPRLGQIQPSVHQAGNLPPHVAARPWS